MTLRGNNVVTYHLFHFLHQEIYNVAILQMNCFLTLNEDISYVIRRLAPLSPVDVLFQYLPCIYFIFCITTTMRDFCGVLAIRAFKHFLFRCLLRIIFDEHSVRKLKFNVC